MCRAKLTDRTPTSLIIARAKRTLCMRHVGHDTDSNFRGRRDLAINRMSPCSPARIHRDRDNSCHLRI